jgi:hypothetical protein
MTTSANKRPVLTDTLAMLFIEMTVDLIADNKKVA